MTVARELILKDGKLFQLPVRELENYRGEKVEYKNVEIEGVKSLEGIEGRCLDMTIKVKPGDYDKIFSRFTMYFAKDAEHSSRINFYPGENIFETDRRLSGSRRANIHQRSCNVKDLGGEIELRIIMDRFSIEVFINGGEQAMTTAILTDPSAREICFECDGKAVIDITKYSLFSED